MNISRLITFKICSEKFILRRKINLNSYATYTYWRLSLYNDFLSAVLPPYNSKYGLFIGRDVRIPSFPNCIGLVIYKFIKRETVFMFPVYRIYWGKPISRNNHE